MPTEPFGTLLPGGHPDSLGRTVEVVRLRTSSALERVGAVHPDRLAPHVDGRMQTLASWPAGDAGRAS